MKPQLIKDITAACARANPEIMELKFGCEVRAPGLEDGEADMIKYTLAMRADGVGPWVTTDESMFDDDEIEEILGRPLQLADILLAIDKAKGPLFGTVATNGWFHYQYKKAFWKHSLPLHDQDIPTLEFIHSLIHTV